MITFTREAFEKCTIPQLYKIAELASAESARDVDVTVDFSLPADYIAVTTAYTFGSTIYGGINGKGEMRTREIEKR